MILWLIKRLNILIRRRLRSWKTILLISSFYLKEILVNHTKSIAVKAAIDSGGEEKFIYLRRFESDCKDSLCINYFADLPIYEMTNGKYDIIDVYRKGIYLANIDPDTGKISNRKKIGYCHALSIAERYKSLMFPDVKRIIYEEFISKSGNYLTQNEPDYLMDYVSTIFRHRTGHVYLIGNKISRICPYFRKWELKGILKQQVGTIDTYKYVDDDGTETKLGVYSCDNLGYNTGMFFGHAAKNITSGAYETQEQPHLEESEKHFREIYKCVVKFEDFMWICKFLKHVSDPNRYTWYVIPKTEDITFILSGSALLILMLTTMAFGMFLMIYQIMMGMGI